MRTEVKTIEEAWSSYFSLCDDERVFVAEEPAGLETTWQMLMSTSGAGPSAWTDAYLAAFAATCGYLFVTLDKGFLRWGGLNCHILRQSP